MIADKILVNINQIFSPTDNGQALKGKEMAKATLLENGFIAVKNGKILAVGEGQPEKSLIDEKTELIDCTGKTASPGLIDSHTHLVYGGSREHEFAKKINGVPYLEILKQGGGILNTVKATRESSFEELYEKSEKLLERLLIHGVTTVEAKSGYGLNWEVEKRQMEVARKLNTEHPVDLVSTFMAAHAVPLEFRENREAFINLIIDMLPKVKAENLAEFCDVFCEEGAFTVQESRKILTVAKELGFKLKIHADEIESIGGVELAGELETTSAEHLMAITESGMQALKDNHVIANILPGTTFSLMKDTYAPARKMIEHDLAIALSTDSNPGSCPTANMQFIMQLGCFAMRMTPIEVFNAVTINAAYCVNRGSSIGSFCVGKKADIVLFDAPNIDYAMYFFATNLVSDVYKDGELIVANRQVLS